MNRQIETVGLATRQAQVEARPAPDCSPNRAGPWRKRLASSAGRRVRAFWRRLKDRGRPPAVEMAIEWLRRRNCGEGLSTRAGGPPCPGLTAAIVPTLLEFGQADLARAWAEWLLSKQLPDGGFPRADAIGGSVFNTALALHALNELTAAGITINEPAAHRAARHLASRLVSCQAAGEPMLSLQLASGLCCLPPLAAAARRFEVSEWGKIVEEAADRARRLIDWQRWDAPARFVPCVAEAWLDLGHVSPANDALHGPNAAQRRNGAVSAEAGGRWGDHAALAHLAALWYRLGNRPRADRAMNYLESRQTPTGAWRENWGRGCLARESAWVVKHYLDAAHRRVASSFAGGEIALPDSISPDDGRLLAVELWLAAFDNGAKVADVGCGSGRFVRALTGQRPDVRFVGIDGAAALLGALPASCERRHGGMLRLPAADGEFDGACAVESLEHSLLPRRAVDELCRAVRPGGRLLIIDKHSSRKSLSLHQPWERWFLPETVAGWLAPHCHEITCRPITHGSGSRDRGLFLCWQATRTSAPAPR